MRVAIFGSKTEAQYLYEQGIQNQLFTIEYFVDNDISRLRESGNLPNIVSIEKLIADYPKYIDAVIIAMRGSYSRLAVIHQLKEFGISRIGVFKFSYSDFKKEIVNLESAVFWLDKLEKPFMPYVEYNVTDSCNLKCKGCTHFSNLCDDKQRANVTDFENDISKLSEKVVIGQLRLLGGEPLLHEDLAKFIMIARKKLKDADISIVTNGLLIAKLPDVVFDAMRDNSIGFHISHYIPTDYSLNTIKQILKEKGVDYYIDCSKIQQFGKSLNVNGNSDVLKAQKACISLGCRFLKDGRLYKCPFEGLIHYFRDKYQYYNIPIINGVDIYKESLNWNDVLEELYAKPSNLCHWCAETCEWFDWEVKRNPEAEDWIVDCN